MNVRDVLNSPASMRLALAFLHFLWQGLAIALLAFVAAKALAPRTAFGHKSARVRHGVYMAALVAMVVCVAVTYAVVQVPSTGHVSEAVHDPNAASASRADAGGSEAAVTVSGKPFGVGALDLAAHRAADADRSSSARLLGHARQAAPYAVGVYLAGVVLMLGRLLLGLQGGGRLRRRSRPVDDPAILAALGRQARALRLAIAPALAYCSHVLVPTVVGVFRPIILLPFSFASGLATEQVEALLAHELAHIRRLDPLLNVVQRVIEALLFFHPAVWFVSHRVRVEREHCCDDLVVGVSASASTYAASLLEAARRGLQVRATARLAPQGIGLADRPSRLRARIVRLLGHQAHERMRLRWTWLMGLVLAVSVGLVATVSLGGGPADDDTSDAIAGQPEKGDATAPKATWPPGGGTDAILEILREVGDSDASLQVEVELQLLQVSRAALKGILNDVAPDSGDPSLQPLVLSADQRKALDAALAELPGDDFQRLSAPRLTTLNRTKAAIEVIGEQDEAGEPVEGVRFSCAPVVSADHKSIVLVLFSKTVKGKPAGSLRFGSDAFQLPGTDEGGLMAAYRIPNGGTLVLTGPDGIPAGRGPGLGGGPVSGGRPPGVRTPGMGGRGQPYVQLALVRARTINEEAAAARRRMLEKLDTRIPQVDFRDAHLNELIDYLAEEAGVNIVVDPEAFPDPKQADDKFNSNDITLSLKDVPIRDVLRYVLRFKGLKYVVEDHLLVVVPIDDVPPEDGALEPADEEAAAARRRIVEKLNTHIPQIDFKDAPLKEVIDYLSREMDVNIVIDPSAAAHLQQADGDVTLKLKDVPFRDVLRHLLRQKGLKFTVEGNALVVVPIDPEPAGEAPGETILTAANLDEFVTEVFRLSPGADRNAPDGQGDGEMTQIEDMIRHGGVVEWPEGSSIAYDEHTKALIVTNTRLNMVAIREMIRVWNALGGDGAEGGDAEASAEAVASLGTAIGETVSIRVRNAVGGDAAADTADEEATAARRRMFEKLNTVIPEVDFRDADLKEVIDYLSREMDVNIVIDPTAFPEAEAADGKPVANTVTLKLKNVPLKHVLKYMLKYKGLKYIVEDHALVIVPADDAPGQDGAIPPGVAEAAAALGRIIEKLNTRIPQVDFKDAPLKEVINFLGREMDVNIVIDPAALAHLEQAGDGVTLSVKDMPFRDVLRHLLKQKGLKFTVEDNALVVVPIDDEPAEEMKTEVFHLLVSGVRTIVPPNGERREETIDEWLRRAEGVVWPAGSSITYHKRTETLTVKNAPGNMGAIYAKIRAWNSGAAETDPPGLRAIIRTTALTESENAAGEKITTAMFNLQASGTRTVSDAGGERRIETIDEWLRGAEGVTWPQGSRLVYDARIEMLTVSNSAENMAVIHELVKAWEARDGDAAADAPGEGIHEKDAN